MYLHVFFYITFFMIIMYTENWLGLGDLSARFILVTVFTSNFIGIAFARSLHYQFYCWYFHTLPYLLWHCSEREGALTIPVWGNTTLIFVIVEVCFNVFPATWWSSALLQVINISQNFVLICVFYCIILCFVFLYML